MNQGVRYAIYNVFEMLPAFWICLALIFQYVLVYIAFVIKGEQFVVSVNNTGSNSSTL